MSPVPAALPTTAADVERLIAMLPLGSTAPVTSFALQRKLGLPDQRTAETVRALVQSAIFDHGYAIGSNTRGYFLIASRDELRAVQRGLETRIRGLVRRRDALSEAWNRRNGEEP